MATVLIDTNVLVYMFDPREPARQKQAIKVLRGLEQSANGRLSVQCLSELSSVVMRRLDPPMSPVETLTQVERFQRIFPVFNLTPMIILEALRGVRDYQFSYYDAQIWATARLNQTPVIFSEDFNPGQITEGVHFVNPFTESFRLDDWLA
jgi:predicted nucleic acid-binding protein